MKRRRRSAAVAIVGLALCAGLGSIAMVTWSSRAGGGGDRHSLEISSIDLTTGTQGATLSARDMVPGDAVTAAVTVVNSSSQPMTYAMSSDLVSAGGAALAKALVLTIKTIGSSCPDFDGVTLFEGPVSEAAFGNDGAGRPLAPATADILCFRASLPIDADNELQGATSTFALVFDVSRQAAVR